MFGLGWSSRWIPCGAAAALALLVPVLAAGQATLGAKGDTVHGHVADLTAEHLIFEPASGKGQVAVLWKEVQSLETDGIYTVLHGDEGEARGRILGVEGGKTLLIGDAPATAERIDVSTLFHACDESKATGSWVESVRGRLRFWAATFDLGGAYTESTTDTLLGSTGFVITRKKAPTRLLLEAAARYADQNKQHEDRTITAYGTLWRARAEYLPAIDDWQDDYLARAETSIDVPMLQWLAFRLAFADEYDNTPAPGAQRNKFSTTAGFAIRFTP